MDKSPEKNFINVYNKISSDLIKKDLERSKRIGNALLKGEYIDDPVYIEILMTDDRFIKTRENFLKKYFTHPNKKSPEMEKSKSRNMPLLDKYATMKGDIVRNMMKDEIFYKYDHSEGKTIFNLYNNLYKEIDEEEHGDEGLKEDPLKLGLNPEIEEQIEEDQVANMHEYIKDRLTEIQSGYNKSLLMDNIMSPKKIEKLSENLEYEKNKGRSVSNKKNKKITF
jgi:hypothetical protein